MHLAFNLRLKPFYDRDLGWQDQTFATLEHEGCMADEISVPCSLFHWRGEAVTPAKHEAQAAVLSLVFPLQVVRADVESPPDSSCGCRGAPNGVSLAAPNERRDLS